MKRRILQVCSLKHSIKKTCILFWAKWTYLGWAGWWVGRGVLPPLAKHLHIKTYFTFFHHSFHSFQFEVSCKIFAALLTFSNCKLIKFSVSACSYSSNVATAINSVDSHQDNYWQQYLRALYMRPEVNSKQFEILLWGKISLRYEVTSLSAFTWLRV